MTGFTPEPTLIKDVDKALADCQQGDVVAGGWMVYACDTDFPLTPEGGAAADRTSGATIAVVEAAHWVVLTQTCDIQRTAAERPFLTVAPLVELSGTMAEEARGARRPRYAHVPALGTSAFADLDQIMTVEKSLMLGRDLQRGCGTAEDVDRFRAAVGRKFARVAYPEDLRRSLDRLVKRIKEKHNRPNSEEGRALRCLHEIRAIGEPDWDGEAITVFLIFAPLTRTAARAVRTDEQWSQLVNKWLELCEPVGLITKVDGELIPLDELTALQYVDSDPLDLDYLSG